MYHFTALCYLIGSLLPFVSCTECWHCENATSSLECLSSGYLTQCQVTEVCSTEVRKVYNDTRTWKRCKQRDACENQRLQNWMRDPYTCNNDREISHCWCCCDKDSCNVNETCEVTSIQCPMPSLQMDHGQVTCSNLNHLGSLCSYTCNETGYHSFPPNKQDRLCLGSGKWSENMPCCVKPCPPFVPLDLVTVLHFNSRENYLNRAFGFTPMVQNLTHNENYYQEFNVYYNEKVYEVLSPQDDITTGDFQPSMNNTANTGAALWYVYNNLFNDLHRRSRHSDVMFVGVEKESDDDVTEAAARLKKAGVTIYYAFFQIDEHTINMDEARAVASSVNHIFDVKELNVDNFRKVFDGVISEACHSLCPIAIDD